MTPPFSLPIARLQVDDGVSTGPGYPFVPGVRNLLILARLTELQDSDYRLGSSPKALYTGFSSGDSSIVFQFGLLNDTRPKIAMPKPSNNSVWVPLIKLGSTVRYERLCT